MTFRQDIQVFRDANLSPAAQSARLAKVAREAVAELIAANRATPRYTRSVDGRPGADESSVLPDGRISYAFHYIGDAAEFALTFLRYRASPIASGRYRDGFRVSVDGRPFDVRTFDKTKIPPGAEVFVYNVEPYSRKIDVGMSGTRTLRYRIPSGLFEAAASAVRRQFGNSVSAKRLYTVRFPGQGRAKHSGRIIDSPALAIAGL